MKQCNRYVRTWSTACLTSYIYPATTQQPRGESELLYLSTLLCVTGARIFHPSLSLALPRRRCADAQLCFDVAQN